VPPGAVRRHRPRNCFTSLHHKHTVPLILGGTSASHSRFFGRQILNGMVLPKSPDREVVGGENLVCREIAALFTIQ